MTYRLPEATVLPAKSEATTVADKKSKDRVMVPAGSHLIDAITAPASRMVAARSALAVDS